MAITTTKTSIIHTIQRKTFFPSMVTNQSLPISQTNPKDPPKQGLKRRLSSLSLKIQPISSPSTSWVGRSKSMSAIGDYAGSALRKWWDLGWSWILSRKPTFARDIEMNEEETTTLGCQSKGTWRHVFYKIRSEFRRLVGSDHLPTTQRFRYDSFSYSQNFDDGKIIED
ncbi:hypothetical protein CKAN_01160800 [Cinnamomum micranthum f. kanehirae]|uniref:Uncharacterized protein n=1 Tax=Cinnamomum micranthum f. kanehirae TaxID=337451 RepID=A0A443NWL7_9MAGN|nr:hypothetical protein CKAN_01160800 [Cinnamomum micranthum f. kanehirae]